MKKSGDFLLYSALAIGTCILISILRKSFDPRSIQDADSIQLGNRLIEFFEKDQMEEIYQRYYQYVDMGLTPNDAFELLVGGLND